MAEEKQKPQPRVNQELQAQYNQFKSALTQLSQKIGDIESQSEEHKLVIETLDGVDESRKCFRMVGGVLVEKTVGDVKPVLKTNHEGLQNVLKKMEQEYKTKDKEMQDWQKKHNVQVVRTN